jgi:hypothetical protein
VAVSHLLRRHRLTEGVVSTVSAAQLFQHLPGSPRVAIFPETVCGDTPLPEGVSRLPLFLGEVQLSVLRATRMPMIRPAQAFLVVLQRRLDLLISKQPAGGFTP